MKLLNTKNEIRCRFTNLIYDDQSEFIFAVDDKGLLHKLTRELQIDCTSAATSHGVVQHGLCGDDQYIYTRDVAGNVVRWDKQTLQPTDFLLSQHFVDPEQEQQPPVPSPSHGITIINDLLVFCNSRGSLTALDKNDLSFAWSVDVSSQAFIEHISVDQRNPEFDLLVIDVIGQLYRFNVLEKTSTRLVHLSSGVSHSIQYDETYDRYWITSDVGGGVYLLCAKHLTLTPIRFTNDDVEEIVISEDGQYVYVACFDHYIYTFKNEQEPTFLHKIGPFKFQVNHLKRMGEGNLLATLESGEIYTIHGPSAKVMSRAGGTVAYWDILLEKDTLLCISESGVVDQYQIKSKNTDFSLRKVNVISPNEQTKRIRIAEVIDQSIIGVCSNGKVIRFNREGHTEWVTQLDGILRDISKSPDSKTVAIASETGWITIIDAATGTIVAKHKTKRPVWCVQYTLDGDLVYGERELKFSEPHREPSQLVLLDGVTLKEKGVINAYGNNKRIRLLKDGKLLVSGNGKEGIRLIDPKTFSIEKNFSDWQINTPENSIIHHDFIYVVTYGYQLITYSVSSGETLEAQFVLEGYPKGLEIFENEKGIPFLLVSCRNCLMVFCIAQGMPELVLTKYLYDAVYMAYENEITLKKINTTSTNWLKTVGQHVEQVLSH
ncbi:MAG: hypothetical protein V4525_11350 [Pseudomonadota bacterium]